VEVSPSPLEEKLEGEGEVLQISGRELLVRAERYRRSAWFFLSRREILYGDIRLKRASAAEGGAEMVEVSTETSPIRKQLLQWAVRTGALNMKTVSAVQSDVNMLSTYSLTVKDDGIEWRKNVQ
jgi:hypothetical protein